MGDVEILNMIRLVKQLNLNGAITSEFDAIIRQLCCCVYLDQEKVSKSLYYHNQINFDHIGYCTDAQVI